MFIPGVLISVATFPGVIVHEAAHFLFCRLRRVPVFEVCFFRFGNPVGYVAHAEIANFNTAFLVTVGPFMINSVMCVLICLPALIPVRVFGVTNSISGVVLWLGVSIGMHAFPSTGDARALLHYARKAAGLRNPLALLSFPLVVLMYLANMLSVVWADYFYGLAIGLLLPSLLL
jgi:hypothetical protein